MADSWATSWSPAAHDTWNKSWGGGVVPPPVGGAGAGGSGLDWQQQRTARRTSSGVNTELERKARKAKEEKELMAIIRAIASGIAD